jgi:High potential iron-sulfur protein
MAAAAGRFTFSIYTKEIVMTNRREFMVQVSLAGGMLASSTVWAQGAMVADADPQAAALGYKTDGTKTDVKKYPKYAAGQQCANCALFQGKAGDASGGCPLFAGKKVAAKGWCSAYAKKA